MSKSFSIALMLVLAGATAVAAPVMLADLRPERDATQAPVTDNASWQGELGGRQLQLEMRADRVRVRPSDDDRVHVSGILREFETGAVPIELKASESPTSVRVAIAPGELERRGSHFDIFVRVPRGAKLEIIQHEGSLTLTDLEATIVATTRWGALSADGVTGALQADVGFGDLEVRELQGSLVARVASGDVRVERVSGDVRLDGRLGEVQVDEVDGQLNVDWPSGRIYATAIGGDAIVRGAYGRIVLVEIGGRAELRTEGADAVIRAAQGGAEIVTSHGSVVAESIGGDLEVVGDVAEVRLSEISGSVRVRTSHGPIEIDGVGGAIHVEGETSSVLVRGLDGAALTAAHHVRTTYGDVRWAWPGPADRLAFEAKVFYGRIESAFPAERQSAFDSTHVIRSVDAPQSRLSFDISSGNLWVTDEP